jgi:hypothetical protein
VKATLKPGLAHRFTDKAPENETVPYAYPAAPAIAANAKNNKRRASGE